MLPSDKGSPFSKVALDAVVVWQHLPHIHIDYIDFCGVVILDFLGHTGWKGRHKTMSLVIFVYVCPILDYMPFKDDVEYLARLVTDIAIKPRGNVLQHFICVGII